MTGLPTARLVITDVPDPTDEAGNERVHQECLAFAQKLVDQGERPWFEVWYQGVTTVANFDALELVDGALVTLPPYSELVGP